MRKFLASLSFSLIATSAQAVDYYCSSKITNEGDGRVTYYGPKKLELTLYGHPDNAVSLGKFGSYLVAAYYTSTGNGKVSIYVKHVGSNGAYKRVSASSASQLAPDVQA